MFTSVFEAIAMSEVKLLVIYFILSCFMLLHDCADRNTWHLCDSVSCIRDADVQSI